MRVTRKLLFTTGLVAISFPVFFSGCIIVPVRTNTVVQNPSGQKQKLPSLLPVEGTTTRQEVEERYRGFGVNPGVPNIFWGRFRKSSWAVFFAAGGPGAATGGGGRVWGVHNLLVTFGDDGKVKRTYAVTDKELLGAFELIGKEQGLPPLDLSKPIRIGGMVPDVVGASPWPVDVDLSGDGMVVTTEKFTRIRHKNAARSVATVKRSQIADVKFSAPGDEIASEVEIELKFTSDTSVGKSVRFSAPPQVAIVVARWLQQVKP